jgi:hypothetical protein
MTDDPVNVADSLNILPDKPWSPTPALPEMTYAEAANRRDELYGNTPAAQEWRDRYFSGSVEAKAEMDRIVRALTPAPPQPSAPDSVDGLIEWAYSIVPGLSEAHIAEIRDRQPVSPEIRRRAEQWFERQRRDQAFVTEYFNENPEIVRQVFHYNTIMALPVRDPQT